MMHGTTRSPVMKEISSTAAKSNGLAIATRRRLPSTASGNTKCFSASAVGIVDSVADVTCSNSDSTASG
jgi:hypothetical protein